MLLRGTEQTLSISTNYDSVKTVRWVSKRRGIFFRDSHPRYGQKAIEILNDLCYRVIFPAIEISAFAVCVWAAAGTAKPWIWCARHGMNPRGQQSSIRIHIAVATSHKCFGRASCVDSGARTENDLMQPKSVASVSSDHLSARVRKSKMHF